jgi:hypothetical protein
LKSGEYCTEKEGMTSLLSSESQISGNVLGISGASYNAKMARVYESPLLDTKYGINRPSSTYPSGGLKYLGSTQISCLHKLTTNIVQ